MKAIVVARSANVQYIDDGPGYCKRFLVNVELIVADEREVDAVKIAEKRSAK